LGNGPIWNLANYYSVNYFVSSCKGWLRQSSLGLWKALIIILWRHTARFFPPFIQFIHIEQFWFDNCITRVGRILLYLILGQRPRWSRRMPHRCCWRRFRWRTSPGSSCNFHPESVRCAANKISWQGMAFLKALHVL
jgi:hypothetical protein